MTELSTQALQMKTELLKAFRTNRRDTTQKSRCKIKKINTVEAINNWSNEFVKQMTDQTIKPIRSNH